MLGQCPQRWFDAGPKAPALWHGWQIIAITNLLSYCVVRYLWYLSFMQSKLKTVTLNVGLMLGHRQWRWTSIKPALGEGGVSRVPPSVILPYWYVSVHRHIDIYLAGHGPHRRNVGRVFRNSFHTRIHRFLKSHTLSVRNRIVTPRYKNCPRYSNNGRGKQKGANVSEMLRILMKLYYWH